MDVTPTLHKTKHDGDGGIEKLLVNPSASLVSRDSILMDVATLAGLLISQNSPHVKERLVPCVELGIIAQGVKNLYRLEPIKIHIFLQQVETINNEIFSLPYCGDYSPVPDIYNHHTNGFEFMKIMLLVDNIDPFMMHSNSPFKRSYDTNACQAIMAARSTSRPHTNNHPLKHWHLLPESYGELWNFVRHVLLWTFAPLKMATSGNVLVGSGEWAPHASIYEFSDAVSRFYETVKHAPLNGPRIPLLAHLTVEEADDQVVMKLEYS
jgi:hypothetical protein